jgi:uncharacterized protein
MFSRITKTSFNKKNNKNTILEKQPPPLVSKKDIYNVVPLKTIQKIINDFKLELYDGYHSIYHWLRVMENGLTIASMNGANKNVIIAFSLFHDSKRINDDIDLDHGFKGAKYLELLQNEVNLTKDELILTIEACQHHNDRKNHSNIDIGTCWDADRLDLMRVGIYPNKDFMSTTQGKEAGLIVFCNSKAHNNIVPDWGRQIIEDIC